MQTNIRKWGNSAGALIPAATLKKAGLQIGDALDIEVLNNAIVLKAAKPQYTLEGLLADTSAHSVQKSEEDQQWLNAAPVGKEEI
jgi:antitoxin MazE/antitoxin ChpS